MRYLLDVNALVALGFQQHEFHERVARWVKSLAANETELATCSITELGFVRVLAQSPQYAFNVSEARSLLLRLKAASGVRVEIITDDHDVSRLPSWARAPRQITDGHLAGLARAKGAVLATLDHGIPGALLIPSLS